MGTNYYFMSRNKELMQTYFAERSVCIDACESVGILSDNSSRLTSTTMLPDALS